MKHSLQTLKAIADSLNSSQANEFSKKTVPMRELPVIRSMLKDLPPVIESQVRSRMEVQKLNVLVDNLLSEKGETRSGSAQ